MSALISAHYTVSKDVKRRASRKGDGISKFTPSTSKQDLKVLRAIHMMDLFDRITIANTIDVPFGTVSRVISQLMNSGYVWPLNKSRVFTIDELNQFPWARDHAHNYDDSDNDTISSALYEKTAHWPKLMQELTKVLKKRRKP